MAFKRFEGQPLAFFCPDGFRPERILVKYNYAVYFVVHPYLTVRQGQRGDFRNPLIPGPRGPRGSLYGGFFHVRARVLPVEWCTKLFGCVSMSGRPKKGVVIF